MSFQVRPHVIPSKARNRPKVLRYTRQRDVIDAQALAMSFRAKRGISRKYSVTRVNGMSLTHKLLPCHSERSALAMSFRAKRSGAEESKVQHWRFLAPLGMTWIRTRHDSLLHYL